MLLDFGIASGIGWVESLSDTIFQQPALLGIWTIFWAVVLWLVYYALDYEIDQQGPTSWLYQMGDLNHTRPLMAVLAVLVVGSMIIAVRYEVHATNYWILATFTLLMAGVATIERFAIPHIRLRLAGARLRLLLRQLPGVGQLVRGHAPRLPSARSSPSPDPTAPSPDPTAPSPDPTAPSPDPTAPSPGQNPPQHL
ncbi:MAG: hypothetical protein HGA19_14215 [Oscillochloris sp.]|nr:hypothetical protein [Oscillochloris sp.]